MTARAVIDRHSKISEFENLPSSNFKFSSYGVTVTLTWRFVQQHWNPPPPSPLASLAWRRMLYSPGALNFAVVDAFPSSMATAGRAFSNVTDPGPLNLLQVMLAGEPCRGRASGGVFPSSVTHTASASSWFTLAFNDCAIPRGGPVKAVAPA